MDDLLQAVLLRCSNFSEQLHVRMSYGIGNVALICGQVLTRREVDDMIGGEISQKANAKDLIDDGEKPNGCGSKFFCIGPIER
jgi:hypothetical protein